MRLILSTIVLFLTLTLSAQTDSFKLKNDSLPDRFYLLQEVERNGVAMPEVEIKEVTIVGGASKSSSRRRDYKRYERLIYNIKRAYPYALIVRDRLSLVNDEIGKLNTERERKAYLKNVEKDVFAQYENDIAHLTITQGIILIKLIDRETQNTSYELIREYRGWISAFFWQGIARLFGTNLKAEYDRFGDDAAIEMILIEIETGRL